MNNAYFADLANYAHATALAGIPTFARGYYGKAVCAALLAFANTRLLEAEFEDALGDDVLAALSLPR